MSNMIIRNMSYKEVLDIAVRWAREEGWNPGLHDAKPFYEADPNGYFIGLIDDKPIATVSAVAYDDNFGFLGFYIVKDGFRGKGYGLEMANVGMDYMGNRNMGIDGVVEMQGKYKNTGFKAAYQNIRYEGVAKPNNGDFSNIISLSEIPFDDILKYDEHLFPTERKTFLEHWLKMPDSFALAAVDNSKLTGYSVIRKCFEGYKIGPLFADNPDIAHNLFNKINNLIKQGENIYLDTPEINPEAVAIAKVHGMESVFETARMYTKEEPKIDLNKIFGVTTFELG